MTLKDKRIEWKARYDAWKESGQSISEWCRGKEIKTHQMYYWVQQFREHGKTSIKKSASRETRWLTVQMGDSPLVPPHEKEPIFIHVGSTSIEVRSGTDMNLLSDIIHVLGK
ncbi:hypothetical protein [Virgibacillus sp. Bac330]|uniref:IS66 family insertion sequence element accessory protein TnpA n=1 Tax=Virgibacillus sp. Bac330 TaxID=2419841 RepID=UPI000EF4E6D1|nr:hypothetical protein [Virgibacillus sp. Bac330]